MKADFHFSRLLYISITFCRFSSRLFVVQHTFTMTPQLNLARWGYIGGLAGLWGKIEGMGIAPWRSQSLGGGCASHISSQNIIAYPIDLLCLRCLGEQQHSSISLLQTLLILSPTPNHRAFVSIQPHRCINHDISGAIGRFRLSSRDVSLISSFLALRDFTPFCHHIRCLILLSILLFHLIQILQPRLSRGQLRPDGDHDVHLQEYAFYLIDR